MSATPTQKPPRIITPDLVSDALHHVPPTIERELWVKLAMAIKAELGDSGYELWDSWSSQAEAYNATDARDTWKSIKSGGKVGIASLFYVAKGYGFRFPEDERKHTAAELAALHQKREQAEAEAKARRQAEALQEVADHEHAAGVALQLWERGQEPVSGASWAKSSAYLERKGVQPVGVRLLPGDDGPSVLVPMRDAAGRLWGVQTIDGEGNKRFIKGGRKAGLWCLLGEAQSLGQSPAVLLAEGLATGLSLRHACGLPVAVCFDGGNLRRVAEALRAQFPSLPMLVCGDDDRATAERTSNNPGRKYAGQAAELASTRQAPAAAVFPAGLPVELKDFNDLAKHAGVDVVAAQVATALRDLLRMANEAAGAPDGQDAQDDVPPPWADEPLPGADEGAPAPSTLATASKPSKPRSKVKAAGSNTEPAAAKSAGGDDGDDEFDPFFLTPAGLHFAGRDAEGRERAAEWVCARLDVTAQARTEGADAWGYLLEFTDPDGNPKSWAMPAQMLAGEGSEWAGYLRAMGLKIAPGTKARNLLARFIDTRRVKARAICTDRVGWHGGVYVLPSGSIGQAEGLRYVFQSEGGIDDQYKQRGELGQWRDAVAALAVGNSRLMFALCCAFAGPLLRLAGVESGGFQFRGDSSGGKTTALKVAASVFGPPGYMQRWRTTDNALEATAVQHSDSLLILDEFGQLDPKVAGECAYMLANEQEKGRATRGGLAKRRRTWRLLFLSSGELGLAEHMRQAGKEIRAGQEVRFVDLPLDAGAGMGGLECLHAFDSPQALAEGVTKAAGQHYGTAGRAWVEWLAARHEALTGELAALIEQHKAAMVPSGAAQQVFRVANRFAVVAVAGELATQAGVTGWQAGEVAAAVRQCFDAWLGARGHMDNGEEASMLRQVRGWLEKNGDALFTWSHRAMDDKRANTPYRAGFKRLIGEDGKPLKFDAATDYMEKYSKAESGERMYATVEYMVLPEAFRQEVAKGFDPAAVAALLRRRGHLIHEKDRMTNKQRLPGMGAVPVYHIKPSIFGDELSG